METFIYVVIIVSVIVLIFDLLLLYNSTIYNILFNKKEVSIYKEINKLSHDEFTFDYDTFKYTGSYYFDIKSKPDWHIWFTENGDAVISNKHTHESIVCGSDKRGSKKLYTKLCLLLPNAFGDLRTKYKNVFMFVEYCDEQIKEKLTSIT